MLSRCARIFVVPLVLCLVGAPNASATPIDLTLIGIWSENPGSAAPGSGTGLEKGQKFVVNVTYDPAVTPITETTVDGFIYYTVDLAGGAALPTGGGLIPNGNSLDVLIPLEGMDVGSPFIYGQNELSHRDHLGDPFPSPVTQLHFRDPAGTDLLGFKLETYDAGIPGNFLQMQTEVANIDPGGGDPLVPTGTGVAQMRTGSFDMIIRSLNAIVDSVPVQAEAGAALSYSADKEDFLTHDWTLTGSVEGGATNAPLVGADVDAQRPLILPSENPFVLQPPPNGTRAAENVNKMVGIINSGLTTTTDVAAWQVAVSEDLTGFDGGTDIVLVSYDNTDVIINAAMATPVGDDLQFDLDVGDDDFAINALGLTDFEVVTYAMLLDGTSFTGLSELLATGSQFVTVAEAIALFGVGTHSLEIRAADRVRTVAGTFVSDTLTFEVVPEPGTGILLLLGLLGLQRVSSTKHRR